MFKFLQSDNFIVLAIIPVLLLLFFGLMQWRKKAVKKIGDAELVKQLFIGYSPKLFSVKFFLILIAVVFATVGLADLAKPGPNADIKRTGTDVMIALDVSNSMLAEDIKPNRLERAKQLVSKLIDKLPDNKTGIVIFAGKAYLQMPMSIDHAAAKMYLSSASPDDVSTQGTVIGDALKMCNAAFNTKEKRYRSIVVITDGEDHDEDAIKITKELAERGVTVNTIGIGSAEGAPIKDPGTGQLKTDAEGNTVISKVNEEVLKEIAQNGKGIYQYFTSAEDVATNLQKQFTATEQTTEADTSFLTYHHYYWIFLLTAFILLILESFIPEVKRTAVKSFATLLMMVLSANISFGQTANNHISKGNLAYNKNDYNTAAKSYQNALTESPQNPIASFNLGNALFKSKKAQQAIVQFDNTIKYTNDKSLRAKAFYNKGVVLQSLEQLPQCIEAYKNTLRIDPADEEARQNLQRALRQQQQKQEQQQQQNKKQEQQQQDQQQQQKPKMSQEEAEEKLRSLSEHEKGLQNKLKKVKAPAPDRPEKDW